VKTKTRFKEVLQRSLENLFNHCLEFYLETRGFFSKNLFNHSVRESTNLPQIGLVRFIHISAPYRIVLAGPRNSFGPTESSSHNDLFCNNACEELCNLFLWANRDIFAWQHTTCLGPPKELITPRDGPRCQFLWANRDVFTWQYVNSHGPSKESTDATSKIYFSLTN
jgi:hypothetical protein